MVPVRFTVHAFDRLRQRLNLNQGEVSRLLEEDLCVPIGRDASTTKVHKLFFSEPDSRWFVAVVDESNDEVITILPSDYHNRWRISKIAFEQARRLILNGKTERVDRTSSQIPSVWKVQARIENCHGVVRIVNLGSFPISKYPTPSSLEEDPFVCRVLREVLWQKTKYQDMYADLSIRLGKNGDLIPIVLQAPL